MDATAAAAAIGRGFMWDEELGREAADMKGAPAGGDAWDRRQEGAALAMLLR